MARAPESLVHQFISLLGSARPTSETDGQLLTRWVSAKDNRAFAALVGRHGALVWRISQNILHQREDAEDAFQASFLVLARKAAGLQNHASIAGWLFQTAQRLALKARAAALRRCRHEDKTHQKTTVDPLEEISVREARAILSEELNRLSAPYREPILLCLYEGATQDEAARRLGCSLRTLTRRLERARTLLSQRLSRRGLAPTSALALTLCSLSKAPAQLMHKTITAATQFASGQVLTGTAALLANGAIQTLLLKKVSVCLAFVLAMGGLSVAAGFALVQGKPLTEQVAKGEPKPVEDEKPKPRVDALGDPLPPGAINRIGSSRLRHFGDVTRMLYTPDGKAIVSTSGNYLYLWDAATGKQRWRLDMAGLEDPYSIPVLAASADSTKVALLNNRGFFLFETATGKKLAWHKLRGPIGAGFFWWIAIAPDMSMFAVSDNGVRIHDAITGQEKVNIALGEVGQKQYPYEFEFSADGQSLYVLKNQKEDQKQNVVMIFDTRTGKQIQTIQLPGTEADPNISTDHPTKLIRSQDDRFLAVMVPGIIIRTNARIVLWDLKAGKQRHFIETDLGYVYGGVFSPDGSLLAISSDMPYVVFFDTATGQERGRLSAPPGPKSLAFSPDGKTLAFGEGGCITLCDVATGKPAPPSSETNALGRIQFTNNGKELLSIRQGVDWWDVTNAKSLRHLAGDSAWFHISSVSPDGKLLAASLVNCDMVLIDAVTGKQIRPLDGHKILNPVTAFSPDGTKLYSAGRYITDKPGVARLDPRIIILNVATGRPLSVLQSDRDQVSLLAVSPNGRWLACGAYNGNFIDYVIRIWDLTTGKVAKSLTPLPLREYHPKQLIFSADSSRLAYLGGGEPGPNYLDTIQLWEVETGKEIVLINSRDEPIRSIGMTPDGRMLATGGNKTLHLWEVATGMERGQIKGHENYVSSVDFSPDGKLLASASIDAPVYIWKAYADLKSQSSVARLSKEDREKLWQTLADTDAAVAFHAVCELIAHPKEAVAFLEGSWKQLPRATPQQIQKWIDDLNSEQFAVRKTASTGLERFAAGQETLLREAFKKANSLETRQRLERILGRLDPQRLRNSRMLEVLEQIRTESARQFLRTLAEQKEDTAMAREAAAGLKRVERQN